MTRTTDGGDEDEAGGDEDEDSGDDNNDDNGDEAKDNNVDDKDDRVDTVGGHTKLVFIPGQRYFSFIASDSPNFSAKLLVTGALDSLSSTNSLEILSNDNNIDQNEVKPSKNHEKQ